MAAGDRENGFAIDVRLERRNEDVWRGAREGRRLAGGRAGQQLFKCEHGGTDVGLGGPAAEPTVALWRRWRIVDSFLDRRRRAADSCRALTMRTFAGIRQNVERRRKWRGRVSRGGGARCGVEDDEEVGADVLDDGPRKEAV